MDRTQAVVSVVQRGFIDLTPHTPTELLESCGYSTE